MSIPYFDMILEKVSEPTSATVQSFGENTHWGYFQVPFSGPPSVEDFKNASSQMNSEILNRANISSGLSVLDVGCGFGGTLKFLNNSYNNLRLSGLNIDSRQIEIANNNIVPLSKNSNTIEFVEGNACQQPFQDNSFDRVLAIECAFHFPSRFKFLQESFRVLRPGGILAISDFVAWGPALPLLAVAGIPYLSSLKKTFGDTRAAKSLLSYKRQAIMAGLKVKRMDDVTRNTLPTYEFLNKLIDLEFDGMKSFQKANNFLWWISKWNLYRYYLLVFEKPNL